MNPVQLTALIRAAAADVLTGRGVGTDTLDAIDWTRELARPRDPAHGEYATAVALRAGPALNVPPRALAAELAAALTGRAGIASAEAAGPGFVNLRLAASARGALIDEILTSGDRYGRPAAPWPGIDEDDPAIRYALLRLPPGDRDRAVLDRDLLARRVDDNPAFLVRHAHARMCALDRWASALGVTRGREYGLLDHPAEAALLGTLGEFARVAETRRPDRLARCLERLATEVGEFERTCPALPMGDRPATERHRARLALAEAVRQVLANGLDLLGLDAPERM